MTKLSLTSMAFALACALAMPLAATAPANAATTAAKAASCKPSKSFECKKVCTMDKNKKEHCAVKRMKKKA